MSTRNAKTSKKRSRRSRKKGNWQRLEVPLRFQSFAETVRNLEVERWQKHSCLSAGPSPTGTDEAGRGITRTTPLGQPPLPKPTRVHHCDDTEVSPLTVEEEVEIIRQSMREDSSDKQVNSLSWRDTGGRYTKIRSVMDSGAAETVAPPTMAPRTKVMPSAGSVRGQHYISASKQRIPNLGQQTLTALTSDFQKATMTFQIADVSRPLTSVGEVCDRGNLVVFGPKGGYILSLNNGPRTRFERNGGIYELELWLDDGADMVSDFTRPGR